MEPHERPNEHLQHSAATASKNSSDEKSHQNQPSPPSDPNFRSGFVGPDRCGPVNNRIKTPATAATNVGKPTNTNTMNAEETRRAAQVMLDSLKPGTVVELTGRFSAGRARLASSPRWAWDRYDYRISEPEITESTLRTPDKAESQNLIIARILGRSRGRYVPVTDLMEATGSLRVGARIYELRKAGLQIENRCETSGRMRQSSYRLV